MALEKIQKEEVINKFKLHSSDTGSPEVQIAILSERLNYLTLHLQKHKKDKHSRRGLLKIISQRRSLLTYLKGQNKGRYENLIEHLGIRK